MARSAIGSGRKRLFRFRLPTGADQEAAGREPDDEAGARALLARCVREQLPAVPRARWRPGSRSSTRRPRPSSPRAARRAAPIPALLDAAAILFRELAGSPDALFREVHALALHYHWSEPEILGLDLPRRRRYLESIADGEST